MFNAGSICLKHTKYTLGSSITGEGCWMLAESSTMNLATTAYPMMTTQSIIFQDTTVSIILSYLDTSNVYTLYGIQSGMTFLTPGAVIVNVSYDNSNGYLTVLNADGTRYMVLDIGIGYDPAGFKVASRAVSYTGINPTERDIPDICVCKPPISSPLISAESSSKSQSDSSSRSSIDFSTALSSESLTEFSNESSTE